MPDIVKYYGVNLTDDVVSIPDTPVLPRRAPKPALDGELADGAAFSEEAQGQPEEAYISPVESEIIQNAMGEAGRILSDAVQRAETERDAILGNIQQEAEQIRQNAADEGKAQGFASVAADMQEVVSQIEVTLARMEGDKAGFEAEYEEQLRWLALEIAGKVLAKKVERDDAEMAEMVAQAVHGVQNEAWVRVEVAQEMTRLIGRLEDMYDAYANVTVSAVPSQAGSVMVETPSGVVDASLKTQLENLRQHFQQAMG